MIDIFLDWFGRLLIKIGKELVNQVRHNDFVRVTRSSTQNRYYW